MSDSRRRSQRSSTSHRTSSSSAAATSSSSSQRRSSRHGGGGGGGGAPSNRSSTSLHRVSEGGGGGGGRQPPPSSSTSSSSSSGVGQVYGNLALRASQSRFSLTDQFAATRSVYDFGFDDAASSIFDGASMFSVGTARAPSVRAPSIVVPASSDPVLSPSPWALDEDDDDHHHNTNNSSMGDSTVSGSSTVLVGYSALLEGDERRTNRGGDDDDDDDLERTPKTRKIRPSSGPAPPAPALARQKQTEEQLADTAADLLLDDPLHPVVAPAARGGGAEQGHDQTAAYVLPPVPRTHYEVLGLARRRYPPLRPAQIRAAYFRLFRLLNGASCSSGYVGGAGRTNLMPTALRPIAAACFAQVQEAFETLIDPVRRQQYDRYLDELEEEEEDEEENDDEGDDDVQLRQRQRRPLLRKQDLETTTDMGVRCAVGSASGSGSGRHRPKLAALDYALTQVVRVGLPAVGRSTETGLWQLQRRIAAARRLLHDRYGLGRSSGGRRQYPQQQPWPIRCGTPELRLVASTYALASTTAAAALDSTTLLPPWADRYQPLLPEVLSPGRFAQLAHTRSTGCVVLGYRQEFSTTAAADVTARWGQKGLGTRATPPATLVVDVEAELLPLLVVTTRLARAVRLPPAVLAVERSLFRGSSSSSSGKYNEPLYAEVMLSSGASSFVHAFCPARPRLGLGLSHRIGRGSAFLCADSGDGWWASLLSSLFSAAPAPSPALSQSSSVFSSLFAPLLAPMVEVGYTVSPFALGLHAGRPLTGPADRGLKGVDTDMDALWDDDGFVGVDADGPACRRRRERGAQGTWTVSTAVTGHASLATYLRYGRTLFLTPLWRPSTRNGAQSTSTNSKKRRRRTKTKQRAVRVEAELCADRFAADGYVAVRALAPVRWWGFRRGWTSNSSVSSSSGNTVNSVGDGALPKLGVEVALSAGSGSVHASLYWSRQGQRIKVPFLLLPGPQAAAAATTHHLTNAAKLFVWATVLPMACMAVREFAQAYLRASGPPQWSGWWWWLWSRATKGATVNAAQAEPTEMDLDDEVEQAINRHRAEADELTMVLASAVDAQRVVERQLRALAANNRGDVHSRGETGSSNNDNNNKNDGLVILSAKYGVALADDSDDSDNGTLSKITNTVVTAMASRNGWAPDYEVADVTAAVSALVVVGGGDGGDADAGGLAGDSLLIPRGLRKSRLLGFWDPAPHYRRDQHQQHQKPQQQQKAHGRKVLHVRYLWRGQERIAEVGDREELRLP
ncbi:heat shock protein DNAj [Niveomyces insectorum RCEF 264]|uniref:Heat shock protein DNAj n=1 Tax=Niveomyces insectorum RCEF 264 TaxID=1081102 RepID=A0A162LBF2_9HYPO|nr:heat shock protein DNAj [Niveomyces insectorum RCEF 264]